jgi:predicted  nucleic acid-binding Zn-ribbon protein
MKKWLDKLYTTLEAKEKTLAREKEKGYNTNITENDIKNHKTKMVDTILEKGKKIDTKYKTLKAKGKLDEARALQKDADTLKNHATKLNSSRGGTRRRRRGKGTRKNGF